MWSTGVLGVPSFGAPASGVGSSVGGLASGVGNAVGGPASGVGSAIGLSTLVSAVNSRKTFAAASSSSVEDELSFSIWRSPSSSSVEDESSFSIWRSREKGLPPRRVILDTNCDKASRHTSSGDAFIDVTEGTYPLLVLNLKRGAPSTSIFTRHATMRMRIYDKSKLQLLILTLIS